MIWGYLLHLGYNMWADRDVPEWDEHLGAKPYLRFDDRLWSDLLEKMIAAGINTLVLDLAEGVKYESHPEIAVRDAWTVSRLRAELAKLREMGVEPVPKLNFSTCHDAWLGPYSRCVSTDAYYEVCRDLIGEVVTIFDKPRLFHLGMDEETAEHQRHYEYVVIRQHDLWWHDLTFLINEVQRAGVRPWIWSDQVWRQPEAFFKKVPKSVLQSNWYYRGEFDEKMDRIKAYIDLDKYGYDQVPTGSNYVLPENLERTISFCSEHIAPKRLMGFLQTVWRPTLEAFRETHLQAIEMVSRARKTFRMIA